MCKLMILSGITKETVANAWKFVHLISQPMSLQDQDGLGYAAISSSGELFGERWLTNSHAFNIREPLSDFDRKIIEDYKGMITKKESYNSFGKLDYSNMTSITLHTRMATTGKQFRNTHPFVRGNTSLIHNGVITNMDDLEFITSTCDSEGILNSYVNHQVMNVPKNIQKVAHELDGYYACGVFSETKMGDKILDIFKDDSAHLHAFFIKELNTVVFATAPFHVIETCKHLGWTILSSFDVISGRLLRLDAINGIILFYQDFDPVFKEKQGKKKNKAYQDVKKFRETSGVIEKLNQKYPGWEYDDSTESWSRSERQ